MGLSGLELPAGLAQRLFDAANVGIHNSDKSRATASTQDNLRCNRSAPYVTRGPRNATALSTRHPRETSRKGIIYKKSPEEWFQAAEALGEVTWPEVGDSWSVDGSGNGVADLGVLSQLAHLPINPADQTVF